MPLLDNRIPFSFTFRLTLAFVFAILATTLAAGVPAYLLVSSRLQSQAWDRLSSGETVSRALIQTDAEQMMLLSRLIAQRPTLLRLLQERDRTALGDYLLTLQSSVLLEMLVVHDLQGQSLAGSDTMDWPLDLLKTAQPRVVSPGSNEPPTLIVTQGIFNLDHQDELMGQYAGEYIFLQDDEVILSGPDFRNMGSRRGLSRGRPDHALWLKLVDPEDMEGEKFKVYKDNLERLT